MQRLREAAQLAVCERELVLAVAQRADDGALRDELGGREPSTLDGTLMAMHVGVEHVGQCTEAGDSGASDSRSDRSFIKARCSSCRMRSRERPNCSPVSASVRGRSS